MSAKRRPTILLPLLRICDRTHAGCDRHLCQTIFYCLIVLRSIHGKAPIPEVPHVSVTVGTALALICVLALLALIQGVARSIVADEVVRCCHRPIAQVNVHRA
jgi:uncharacterized membrane protein